MIVFLILTLSNFLPAWRFPVLSRILYYSILASSMRAFPPCLLVVLVTIAHCGYWDDYPDFSSSDSSWRTNDYSSNRRPYVFDLMGNNPGQFVKDLIRQDNRRDPWSNTPYPNSGNSYGRFNGYDLGRPFESRWRNNRRVFGNNNYGSDSRRSNDFGGKRNYYSRWNSPDAREINQVFNGYTGIGIENVPGFSEYRRTGNWGY